MLYEVGYSLHPVDLRVAVTEMNGERKRERKQRVTDVEKDEALSFLHASSLFPCLRNVD
jgi:hypothetical protein